MEPFTPDTDERDLDPGKPLILMLGSISHEGVVSALSAAGRQYKQKYPESKVDNWRKIIKLFDEYQIATVVWKLSPSVYHRIADDKYTEVVRQLFGLIENTNHAIYVHVDLLDCDPSISESSLWEDWPEENIRRRVKETLDSYDLEYLSYTRNAELTVLASKFLADMEHGLLLRLYIPQKRLWAQEAGKLLQLFRDYIEKVSKFRVRLDQTRTDLGTIYEFHGDGDIVTPGLADEFSEFSNFLDVCIRHPEQAELLLRKHDIDSAEISDIISRFTKEARRLQVDFKQERERKLLAIRHRMESELTDHMPTQDSGKIIDAIVDSVLPASTGLASFASVGDSALTPLAGNATPANLNVYVNSQVIQAARSIVANEISGNVDFSDEDRQIINLIYEYGGAGKQDLLSDINELSDASAPMPGRLKAKRGILKFLGTVASKAGDVGAGVLQSYIEHKMGI